MSLKEASAGKAYTIRAIETGDEAMNAFLFSLGCFAGETITLVSHLRKICIVGIKDSRYSIDHALAEAIRI